MVEDPWLEPTLTEISSSLSLNPDGHRGLMVTMVWCILLMRIGFEFWYLWYCVFDLIVFWVLFVLFYLFIFIKSFGFC